MEKNSIVRSSFNLFQNFSPEFVNFEMKFEKTSLYNPKSSPNICDFYDDVIIGQTPIPSSSFGNLRVMTL